MPDDYQPRPAIAPHDSRADLINLANAVTLGRICLVPASVWLVLRAHYLAGFWLFLAAGASDAVDGWLARRHGATRAGTLLDPLADKVLLVSMYVTLAATHELPDWLAILVVFRDVAIVGGVLALSLLGLPLVIRPLWISKLNTVLQIALIAAALLRAGAGFGGWLITPLIPVVTASTLASGAAYVARLARAR